MRFIIFVLGLGIGSFLNVLICRLPLNEMTEYISPARPKSFQRAVQILTGIFFVIAYLKYSFSIEFVTVAILVSLVTVAACIDIDYKIVPDKLVLYGLAVGIPLSFYRLNSSFAFILTGFAAGFLPMFLIAVLSNGQLGFGDVKLAGVMGVFLGWKGVLAAILLAFFTGAVYGLYLMIVLGKSRKTALPFVPFLAGSGVISFLWLEEIAAWFQGIC